MFVFSLLKTRNEQNQSYYGHRFIGGQPKEEFIVINVCSRWGASCWPIVAVLTLFSSRLTTRDCSWTHLIDGPYIHDERGGTHSITTRIIKYPNRPDWSFVWVCTSCARYHHLLHLIRILRRDIMSIHSSS